MEYKPAISARVNVNHFTYYRGQVTNMRRLLGAQPAATDFLECGTKSKRAVTVTIRRRSNRG
jgi:hypothetical protein